MSGLKIACVKRYISTIIHYNKAHTNDVVNIPPWVIKYKGQTYYVEHIEFRNKDFCTKETPDNTHTKGSIKIKGKLIINDKQAIII